MFYKLLEKTAEEIAKELVRSAMVGAATDAVLALVQEEDPIKAAKELGCGATTGAAGAGARMAYEHFTKDSGYIGKVVGIGAAIGTRIVYRRKFFPPPDDS